jgi:hypothetical protein
LKKSDLIITHAKDGVDFGKSFFPKKNIRIEFFPHPTIKQSITPVENKTIDILIWGAIAEYKGIDKFLEYLYKNNLENKYKILIAGKISTTAYRSKLMKMANKNISIEDHFLEKDKLIDYIQQSRVVLFTYSNDSVLSSGALTDTLTYRGTILGPDTGSFKDLAEEKMIRVYNNLVEIPGILDQMLSMENSVTGKKINSYFEKTSWNNFIIFINGLLEN